MDKTLRIRTIQVGRRLWVEDFMDISVKSGKLGFTPTWHMVWSYKNGAMSQDEYTKIYAEMMTRSLLKSPEKWNAILKSGSVTLGCYCPPGVFCHRLLLAEYLRQYAEAQGYKVIMGGEVLKDTMSLTERQKFSQ